MGRSNELRTWLYTLAFLAGLFGLFYLASWVMQSGCEKNDYVPGEFWGRPWCRSTHRGGGTHG